MKQSNPAAPAKKRLRILVIGAHPDDCEICVGGTGALWAEQGHLVRFVSATNGGTGHHAIGGIELVRRRLQEARNAARALGVESQIMDITNGELEPTLFYRKQFIKLIREFGPDLILTHRPNDYHPDHRYTSQLVQDSAYVVTVPNNLPTVEALRDNPTIAYLRDNFQKPLPFAPDVVVSIDRVIEKKVDAMHCHVSQFYEWLPWNKRKEADVPKGDRERRSWMAAQRLPIDAALADKYRKQLKKLYGAKAGAQVKYAEAFEICEYGTQPTAARLRELFPFFG
ncbi:MAG TPA: PIG-L deacetylase family protein [Planctomycetota bacterium]|nr:PIG-L deacetylase family protein [Planctomycetota bacterium]